VCLVPFGLHLIAAAMKRYPYGEHFKFSMDLAPIICVLAGIGLAAIVRSKRHVVIAVIILSLVAFGSIGRDFTHRAKAPSDAAMREFSRSFWPALATTGRIVCLKTDLGLSFSPRTYSDLSWSAQYLCYQHMYRPRSEHSSHSLIHVVQYHDERFEFDHDALQQWLTNMQRDHELVNRRTHALPRYDKRKRYLITQQFVEVFTFQPRAGR
jgi:hypothetical protein